MPQARPFAFLSTISLPDAGQASAVRGCANLPWQRIVAHRLHPTRTSDALRSPFPSDVAYPRLHETAQRVAGVRRFVLHSLIHFLRTEDLFVIGKGRSPA